MSCLRRQACLIPRVPRQASTPPGRYCHVPNGFTGNATEAIENQVERFAPGFRDCIAARSILGPADLERHNPNLIGGDIGGGAAYLSQLFLRAHGQPLSHGAERSFSLLFFHSTSSRRPWYVRIFRR